jgi:RES domain-containing protein
LISHAVAHSAAVPLFSFPFVLQITVLCQQVVLQELPVPRVTLPRADWKPLDAAAAAASTMLTKQRRVQLLLPPTQLSRLSGLLAQVMQPPAAPAAAAAAAAEDADGAEVPAPEGKGRRGKGQQEKRRKCKHLAELLASGL